jgi:hypothetical protein
MVENSESEESEESVDRKIVERRRGECAGEGRSKPRERERA